MAALDKPWRIGKTGIDSIAKVLAATRILEDRASPAAVLPLALNLVQIIDVYAAEARSYIRRDTLGLASELHCYAEWLSHSYSACIEGDFPDHLSHAASFKGNQALEANRLDQAISLSRISLRDNKTFTALRVFDGYQAGHAYALANDQPGAEKSIAFADRLLDDVRDSRLPGWAYWYSAPFCLHTAQ